MSSSPPNRSGNHPDNDLFHLMVDAVQDYAIFALDPRGYVATWNLGAQRIKGWRASEIVGRHFSAFYPEEVVRSGWPDEELRLAIALGRFEDEGWRVRKDGSLFWANVVITPLYDARGELRGFAKVTRDLTDRKQAEESLRESEERFRLLVDGVRDYALFLLDRTGRVLSWNVGATRLKGWLAEEIIGRHFSCFYTPEDRDLGRPEANLAIAAGEGRFEEEGWRVRKDGSRFVANVVLTALYADGHLRGFAKVTRDVTERKQFEASLFRQTDELRRQADELAITNRRKDEFIAMLSHELGNPLSPLLTAVQILARDEPTGSRAAVLAMMDRQIRHLTRLVDELLDAARVTRGAVPLRAEPVDLREPIERAVEQIRPLAEHREQRVRVSLPRAPVPVEGDPARLEQVFGNLLDNAARYTDPGGAIELVADRDDAEVVVRVRDTGAGIPPALLPRVFEPFAQADRPLARSEGGLGLGLSVVRRIVELHGGAVEARSAGPGQGSEFVVRLPLDLRADAPSPEPPPPAARPLRVLVVDDNEDGAETLAMLLRMKGHETWVAHDGPAALRLAAEVDPDVVLCDVGLPGLDGLEVARRLRRAFGPQVVLAAVTGYGEAADRERTRAAGFDHHLTKPVDLDLLERLLAAAPTALR